MIIIVVSYLIELVLVLILNEIDDNAEKQKLYKKYYETALENKNELTDKEKFAVLYKLTDKLDLKE